MVWAGLQAPPVRENMKGDPIVGNQGTEDSISGQEPKIVRGRSCPDPMIAIGGYAQQNLCRFQVCRFYDLITERFDAW